MAKNSLKIMLLLLFSIFYVINGDAQNLHRKFQDLPCINKNYNVVVHVAVDSINREPIWTEFEVDSIIAETSKYFEPICMTYSLCEYNVMKEDYSLGYLKDVPIEIEDRYSELDAKFAKKHKINIFLLDTIETKRCGDGYFFGIMSQDSAVIFTERDCADGQAEQIAHLFGHMFGLRNTYHPIEIELVDGSNCADVADKICDTPADPFMQTYINPDDLELINQGESIKSSFTSDCEFVYELKDPNGEYYQPDVGNIMSAYPCKCGFTREQYLFIVESYYKVDPKHF